MTLWTSGPPTEAGWYWVYLEDNELNVAQARRDHSTHELTLLVTGWDIDIDPATVTHHIPLVIPEPPPNPARRS